MRQLTAALLLVGFGGQGDANEMRRLLDGIAVDAQAIDQAPPTQDPATLQHPATEIQAFVGKLKLLAPDRLEAQRLLVELTEATGRLVTDTSNQDRFSASADAREILDLVARLRLVL